MIYDLALNQGKEIKPLQYKGGDLPVSDETYSSLFSEMASVFQNSILHGIETPNERLQAGKPAEGTVTVFFARAPQGETHSLKIAIYDDGRGMDSQELNTSPFKGLSQLKSAAKALGGTVVVHSKKGAGTLVTVTVPEQDFHPSTAAIAS